MSLVFASFVAGLLLLAWSAFRTVDGALALAGRLNVSAAFIAFTVLALGTSLPELAVSVYASVKGDSAIAVGNALGSNIANMGMVLSLCILLRPVFLEKTVLRLELPLMLLVVGGASLVLLDGHLGRLEGVGLFLLLVPAGWWLLRGDGREQQLVKPGGTGSTVREIALLLWFLLLLCLGAELLVSSAEQIALEFDIDPFVIGLSLVAAGTSLPELAVSLAGIWRNNVGIMVGNLLGSNIFNLLGVMGLSVIITPWQATSPVFLLRDYGTMVALCLLPVLWLAAGYCLRPAAMPSLHRPLGALLLTGYGLYLYFLFFWS